MTMAVWFRPASAYSLDDIAALYTRTFADYFYPALVTAADMARFVRVESLDLDRSPVMGIGDEAVGLATVGLRGGRAYCKGFGVVVPWRGQGLARPLCEAMLAQAREAGAVSMSLGVLKHNTRAVAAYQRAGFVPILDLVSLAWEGTAEPSTPRHALTPVAPSVLLDHFAAFHNVAPTWHRDRLSLLAMDTLEGLALADDGDRRGYALVERDGQGGADIVDLGASRLADARDVVGALQRRFTRLVIHNEPAGSQALAALREAGFRVTHERYEMQARL